MDYFPSFSKNLHSFNERLEALPAADQATIRRAFELARHHHAGQPRDDSDTEGAGYIIHCLRAANWLLEQGCYDANVVAATLLHDTLEDTALTTTEIKRQFGDDVLKLVLQLTRPRPANEPEEAKRLSKINKFKKILVSDERVRLAKTADLLDNMRSWLQLTPNHPFMKKMPRWVSEAKHYYIPIAESVNHKASQEMKKILRRLKK